MRLQKTAISLSKLIMALYGVNFEKKTPFSQKFSFLVTQPAETPNYRAEKR